MADASSDVFFVPREIGWGHSTHEYIDKSTSEIIQSDFEVLISLSAIHGRVKAVTW